MFMTRVVEIRGHDRAMGAIVLGVFVYATGPVIIQSSSVSGPVLSFWRLWLGVGMFALIVVFSRGSRADWTVFRRWSITAWVGLAFAANQLAFFTAVKFTSVADVALLATLDNRLSLLDQLALERGRPIMKGAIPLFSVDEDGDRARAGIDVDALAESSEGAKHWIKPASGRFETVDDLEGLLVAGSPDDCVREIRKFQERGLDDLIIDLRLQFSDFEDKLKLIAHEVLPRVRESQTE